jgi:NADPH:quinone reductase-like Zn-dependent oxidoreductase
MKYFLFIGLSNFGAYAEYVVIDKDACLEIPKDWSFEDAAGFLVTMITSYHAIVGTGFVYPGTVFLCDF